MAYFQVPPSSEAIPGTWRFEVWYPLDGTILQYLKPYDPNMLTLNFEKTYPIDDTSSQLINDALKASSYNTTMKAEKLTSSPERDMIQRYFSSAKKHLWSTSEFILGGNRAQDYGIPNGYIESLVNPADNILSGDRIILDGLKKTMRNKGLVVTLYK